MIDRNRIPPSYEAWVKVCFSPQYCYTTGGSQTGNLKQNEQHRH